MRNRIIPLLIAIAIPLGTAVRAQTQSVPSWDAVVAQIESGATAGRLDVLRKARIDCLKALASSPGDREPLLRYAVAYIGWRMAVLPDVPKNEVAGLLDDAVEQLKTVVKKNDRFAEAHALLGGVYGLQIGTSAWKGMTLGPRASGAIDKAAALEPDNPRVLLQQGISALHTPPMFGGGVDKADKLLRRSLDQFSKEPREKAWPNWGRMDVHAWLGQVLHKRGDVTGARAQYEQALAIAPEFGWVRYVLLPGLDQKKK